MKHSAKHVSVLHHTWRGKTVCNCVCIDDWIVNELDVGQGFGLCTQGLNDGTLEGWHSSQAEEPNRHL